VPMEGMLGLGMFKRSENAAARLDPARKAGSAPVATATRPSVEVAANQTAGKPVAVGKHAYESRRAAKAGVSLERWMSDKQKRVQADLEAERRAQIKAQPAKRGFFKRLLDRAHKPL